MKLITTITQHGAYDHQFPHPLHIISTFTLLISIRPSLVNTSSQLAAYISASVHSHTNIITLPSSNYDWESLYSIIQHMYSQTFTSLLYNPTVSKTIGLISIFIIHSQQNHSHYRLAFHWSFPIDLNSWFNLIIIIIH